MFDEGIFDKTIKTALSLDIVIWLRPLIRTLQDIKPVIVRGDNHCGYMGFRQPFLPSLIDDGAIDIVVRDWIEH
jgi:hypothetical protein